MEGYGTMPGAAMACMTASLLIAFGLPLGLGLFFRRRGGRWRPFFWGRRCFWYLPWCWSREPTSSSRRALRAGSLRAIWDSTHCMGA